MSLTYYFKNPTGPGTVMAGPWEVAREFVPAAADCALLMVSFDGEERCACRQCGAILSREDTADGFQTCDRCLRDYEARLAGFKDAADERAWDEAHCTREPEDTCSDADPGL